MRWSESFGFARAVLRAERDAIERDDLQRLIDTVIGQVQIQNRDSSGINDTPKLLLARLHLEEGRDEGRATGWDVIHREIGSGVVIGGPGASRLMERTWRRIHRLVVAYDDDALRQAGDDRIDVLDAVDNERAGGAALDGSGRDTVNMRMIPVKAGWLVFREMDFVTKGLTGVDDGPDHFILMAERRSVRAVIVQIDGGIRHIHGAAAPAGAGHIHPGHLRHFARSFGNKIGESND